MNLPLSFHQPASGLRLAYYDEPAFRDAHAEVFGEEIYRFKPRRENPHILDAGANLGLASCYFKSRFPKATITAFEPDPRMQELFIRNMRDNDFEDVHLERCALAGQDGSATFHGDLDTTAPHALGNSLLSAWGLQQPDSSSIEVPTRRLSPYLDKPVDLLKLDIEGAELDVLREASAHLGTVREIRMEIHQTLAHPDMEKEIGELLRSAGFILDVTERPLKSLLPESAQAWFERSRAQLFILRAWRD
jgi:FkbM family methyltransferase